MTTPPTVRRQMIVFDGSAGAAPAPDRAVEDRGPAAFQLLRCILPDWDVEAHAFTQHGRYWVAIWPRDLKPERCYEGRAESLGLAVLTAVLNGLREARAPDA